MGYHQAEAISRANVEMFRCEPLIPQRDDPAPTWLILA
jgi:hypothetical protein